MGFLRRLVESIANTKRLGEPGKRARSTGSQRSARNDADIEILLGDKVLAKNTHKVEVNASDFPAQEVLIAQLGQDVQVSPLFSPREFSLEFAP